MAHLAGRSATVRAVTATGLPLNKIQGNILAGFKKDYQEFLLLRFPNRARAIGWLTDLPAMSPTSAVAKFNIEYRQRLERSPGEAGLREADDWARQQGLAWFNLAFT